MTRTAIALVSALAVLPGAEARAAAESGPAVTVTNFPLDANGSLRTAGTATVSGTVGATQSGPWAVGQAGAWTVGQGGAWTVGQSGPWSVGQAGPWSVALEGPGATALLNIDAATAGLRYEPDGSLKVSVTGGGAADPTPATRNPFGFSVFSSFTGNINIPAALTHVTAYSFHSDRNMLAILGRDGGIPFGIYVAANQPAVGSFAHAIPADNLTLRCLDGATCTVVISAAGY